MSPARLLEQFERLVDTPDAIPRLRRFILDLAVRGKLVEQDPKDEPAGDLLKRIAVEGTSSLRCRRNCQTNDLGPIDEIPFELPHHWEWARLGELGHTQTGTTPSKANKNFFGRHLPFVKPGDLLPNCVDYDNEGLSKLGLQQTGRLAPAGSLLMVCIGTVGKCQVIDRDCSFNQQINSLTPSRGILPRYVFHAASSKYFQDAAIADSSRTTIAILNKRKWEQLLFPVPPLAEQSRIVAKVDELMALCDELEAAQTKRESRRDRLVTATLHRLNNAGADQPAGTFEETSRFYFDHLPRLTTRPEHIKQLRQTILNLAVRGKLVPQDPGDEPATALIEEIRSMRRRGVRGGQQGQTEAWSVQEDEAPFPIPASWRWMRFGELVLSRDGERIPVSKDERSRRGKKYDYYGASGVIDKIDCFLFDKPLLLIGEDGANLINRSSPIAFIARGRYWVNNHAHVLDGISEDLLRYLELFINAIDLKPFVTGTAQPKMNQTKMNSIPVAVPPGAEQSRIVAKVDELMSLCDALGAGLETAANSNGQLLKVYLLEALSASARRCDDLTDT